MKKLAYCKLAILALTLGVGALMTTQAKAENITPSTVYQVTENIIHQLNRMHDSNMSLPDFSSARMEIPDRLPRHVIQQALNVRNKITVLSRVNGIEPSELMTIPVKEVEPADVLNIVNAILEDLTKFDKSFGLDPFKPVAKLEEGKTPTDVYKNLLKAQTMIEQLGIPLTVPNEVFNSAVAVTNEIDLIRKAKGKTTPVDPPSPSIGKNPSDAYTLAYYALKGIQGLAKKPEYQIPNDVVIPARLKKDITPNDVHQILLYCLAELSSMKVATGVSDPMMRPDTPAGQTPSSVFDQLGLVNRQIQSMQW